MTRIKITLLLAGIMTLLATVGSSQPASAPMSGEAMTMMSANEVKWAAAPAILPRGAQMALLAGNPDKSGLLIMRYRFPANYQIPPHWHSVDEYITVISGEIRMGMGDKMDRAKLTSLRALGPGSHARMPARQPHYLWASKGAVVERTAIGPFATTYVNPKDDPTRQQSK